MIVIAVKLVVAESDAAAFEALVDAARREGMS